MPFASACCELAWITGPSAIGSENGTPSSITSAPAASIAFSSSSERARSGCPAVTYTTRARRPLARSAAKRSASAVERLDEIVGNANTVALGVFGLDDRATVLAIGAAVGEIHDRARHLQVAGRVADHLHER